MARRSDGWRRCHKTPAHIPLQQDLCWVPAALRWTVERVNNVARAWTYTLGNNPLNTMSAHIQCTDAYKTHIRTHKCQTDPAQPCFDRQQVECWRWGCVWKIGVCSEAAVHEALERTHGTRNWMRNGLSPDRTVFWHRNESIRSVQAWVFSLPVCSTSYLVSPSEHSLALHPLGAKACIMSRTCVVQCFTKSINQI